MKVLENFQIFEIFSKGTANCDMHRKDLNNFPKCVNGKKNDDADHFFGKRFLNAKTHLYLIYYFKFMN